MKYNLESLRDKALTLGASFVDLRLVEKRITNIQLQDRKIDRLDQTIVSGLGVRVLLDGAWGMVSTNSNLSQGLGGLCSGCSRGSKSLS